MIAFLTTGLMTSTHDPEDKKENKINEWNLTRQSGQAEKGAGKRRIFKTMHFPLSTLIVSFCHWSYRVGARVHPASDKPARLH